MGAIAVDNLHPFGGDARDVRSVRKQFGFVDEGDNGALYRFRFAVPLELPDLKLLEPEQALAERDVLAERSMVCLHFERIRS